MPNRLLFGAWASVELPEADSRMAWAIMTDAYRSFSAAMVRADSPTSEMNFSVVRSSL